MEPRSGGAWDSICGHCGRRIQGIALRRPVPWQQVLPYCRNCGRYALRPLHFAVLAAVLIPLAGAILLALYLLPG